MKLKIYRFIKITFFVLKYTYLNIKKFILKFRCGICKRRWILSKNRNFYNPTIGATVYKYGDSWRIAKNDNHFGMFEHKKDAMDTVFQLWLKEEKIIDKLNELDSKLQDLKNEISDNNEKNVIVTQDNCPSCEEAEENENLRAKYFYLAQTQTNCYKCKKSTLINAIILPKGFETIDEYAIEDLEEQGIPVEKNFLFAQ